MTTADIPANPNVLNRTVLSNFAYIDQLWVVAGLSGICTVPVVREELENGVDDHPYLQAALDTLDDEIPAPEEAEKTDAGELRFYSHAVGERSGMEAPPSKTLASGLPRQILPIRDSLLGMSGMLVNTMISEITSTR